MKIRRISHLNGKLCDIMKLLTKEEKGESGKIHIHSNNKTT